MATQTTRTVTACGHYCLRIEHGKRHTFYDIIDRTAPLRHNRDGRNIVISTTDKAQYEATKTELGI